MSRGASLLLAVTVAGCGGQELLIDTTPSVLIPNGGSAQAGQIEGPTAIPITGAGAIVATPAADPAPTPSPPPMSVMDAAALEATGAADGAKTDDGADGGDSDESASSDDAGNGDDDDAGDADDEPVSAAAPPQPATAAPVTTSAPAVAAAPRIRTVRGEGYALAIPAEWEDLDPTGLGSIFITSASRSMDPGDGFYANVIVSSEPFAGDTQAYAVLSLSPIVEGGARIVATHTAPPTRTHRGHVDLETYWINVTGTPYITLQRYLTTGAAGYVVTCAAAADVFEDHRETCLDVIDSLVVQPGS
jgi:hypothetical protein